MRNLDLMRNPPPGSDILAFALGSTNRTEQEIALQAIVFTDREKAIPLLTVLATNEMINAESRCHGAYAWIEECISRPDRLSGWDADTSKAFLDFCRWAVDNENESACQAGAYRVLVECEPGWRTSDHRRSVLLRWLKNAKSDSQRKFLQRQLDTMYDPPPEPGPFTEMIIYD